MSALVEKKTGFDGSRTLIHGGLVAWCSAGSILTQDIRAKLKARNRKAIHSAFSSSALSSSLLVLGN